MTAARVVYTNGRVFDGTTLHEDKAALFQDGTFFGLMPHDEVAPSSNIVDLDGDILSPGYVDLQVNGGDGLMFNDAPSPQTLARMAAAHRRLGTTRILPTLITDSRETTEAAIVAAEAAIAQGIAGIAGLHLEGPHLSTARQGAHDAHFIRPMEERDLQALISAKARLPTLKVTVAPESVTPDQVMRLANTGILVALGHTDASFAICEKYAAAGARAVTHLFNAMSQLGNREPGLVGAALTCGDLSAGLIADAVHVHPASLQVAWAAKARPGKIYLVSDAMAVAGTDITAFKLNGRIITRRTGQLRLSDGTLAGADLHLTQALSVLVQQVGVPLSDALTAATRSPAALCGMEAGWLQPGSTPVEDLIRIRSDLSAAAPLVP